METKNINVCETFPDGTPIDGWFYDTNVPSLEKIGKQYVLTAYGILDDGKLYTKEIQALIDLAAKEGGGVRPYSCTLDSSCGEARMLSKSAYRFHQ